MAIPGFVQHRWLHNPGKKTKTMCLPFWVTIDSVQRLVKYRPTVSCSNDALCLTCSACFGPIFPCGPHKNDGVRHSCGFTLMRHSFGFTLMKHSFGFTLMKHSFGFTLMKHSFGFTLTAPWRHRLSRGRLGLRKYLGRFPRRFTRR